MDDLTLEAVRKQHPQYGDMSDGDLADALFTKFGNGAPRAQFYAKIGAQRLAPTSPRPVPATDLASMMAGGASQASGLNAQAAPMVNAPSQHAPDMSQLAAAMDAPQTTATNTNDQARLAQMMTQGQPTPPGRDNLDSLLNAMAPPQLPTPTQPQSGAEAMFPATDRSFGIGGFGRSAVNKAADVVGLDVPFPQVQRTVANFDVLGERIVADISSAYDKPPSWMLKRISDLAPSAASPFTGPQQAEEQLRALANDVVGEIGTLNSQLSPEAEMTAAQRQKIEGKLAGMRAANSRILSALESFEDAPEFKTTGSGVKWRIAQ